jgi:hypothetical protein
MNREHFARTAIRRLLGLSLALAMGFPILWPASARAQGGGWEWQNPLPQGNHLQDVWGSNGSDVYAVGELGTILHYDGVDWGAMGSGAARAIGACHRMLLPTYPAFRIGQSPGKESSR